MDPSVISTNFISHGPSCVSPRPMLNASSCQSRLRFLSCRLRHVAVGGTSDTSDRCLTEASFRGCPGQSQTSRRPIIKGLQLLHRRDHQGVLVRASQGNTDALRADKPGDDRELAPLLPRSTPSDSGTKATGAAGGVSSSSSSNNGTAPPTVATATAAAGAASATSSLSSSSSSYDEPPYPDNRTLDREILSIALPMLATLAADPIAGLVDSAYMGRAGSSQLAAVGVALSIFNTTTKLFNVPLLAVTTSSVAKATGEALAAAEEAEEAAGEAEDAEQAEAATVPSKQQQQQQQPQQPQQGFRVSVSIPGGADAMQPPGAPGAGSEAAAVVPAPATDAASVPPTPGPAPHTTVVVPTAATADATATASSSTYRRAASRRAAAAAAHAAALQARAASACILLAALVGLVQAAGLLGGGPGLLGLWGLPEGSPVYGPTLAFVWIRAVGAPITILMLVLQGVYRGLQDTRTPFRATLYSNIINILLAPVLIFGAHLGAAGAAAATVTAQAIPLAIMARDLTRRLPQIWGGEAAPAAAVAGSGAVVTAAAEGDGGSGASGKLSKRGGGSGVDAKDQAGGGFGGGGRSRRGGFLAQSLSHLAAVLPLFRPTGYLVLRSASVSATYAVATTMVARAGPAVTASHQICFQLWLAFSLLADALAVAAQSLMARDLGAGSPEGARMVAARVSGLSLSLGLALAAGLALAGRWLPGLFTSDPEVLALVGWLFPVVAASQPITVLAMAWDGILYGAGGFRYAAASMALAAIPAMLVMQLCGGLVRHLGGCSGATEQLGLVWAGLTVLMLLRWLTIAVPYMLKIGPFRKLRQGAEAGPGTGSTAEAA